MNKNKTTEMNMNHKTEEARCKWKYALNANSINKFSFLMCDRQG